MNADVSILKFNNISIDLNDKRLCNYIFYVDYYGQLVIMNRQTFNLIKFSYIKETDCYCMYNYKGEKISTFMDINIILEQFWNN